MRPILDFLSRALIAEKRIIPLLILTHVVLIFLVLLRMAYFEPDTKYTDKELEDLRIQIQESALSHHDQGNIEYRILPRSYTSFGVSDHNVSVGTANINPALPEDWRTLNEQVYNVSAYYMSKAFNIPFEYRDPLFLGALARTETGAYADINKLYIPAIPTVGLSSVNSQTLSNYGAQETIGNNVYWSTMRPYSILHQGPLQMGINYGIELAIAPEDLVGSEQNEGLTDRYATRYATIPVDWVIPRIPNGGDRYNWADANNRVVGVLNAWYPYIYNIVDNKYHFLALISMAHNVGSSVIVSPDNFNPNVSYFPWHNAKAARDFARAITQPETINTLRIIAQNDIRDWRAGLTRQPDLLRNQSWGYSIIQELNLGSEFYTLKGDFRNRLSYPIKVLYYYFLLEELYSGS